jgi:hypothetical protein
MKKKDEKSAEARGRPGDEKLTRRAALKRIATVLGGGVIAAEVFGRAPDAHAAGRYVSIEGSYVNTVYVDKQYVNRGANYNEYVSFYSSSRTTSPPPPPPRK